MTSVVYTLLDALVSLYPARADGSADTEHPVWKEVYAEGLRLTPKPIVVETRPTGAAAPRRHPLVVTHEISLARVWAPELVAGNPLTQADPQPDAGRDVPDIVWQGNEQPAAGLQMWHRQTYYGVTLESRERGDRERLEFTENYVFAAERVTCGWALHQSLCCPDHLGQGPRLGARKKTGCNRDWTNTAAQWAN